MPYTWPGMFDDRNALLSLVGSFWSEVYGGRDTIASLLAAAAAQRARSHDDLLRLTDSMSRLKVPPFRSEEWTPLVLRESDGLSAGVPLFDGSITFDSGAFFDTDLAGPVFSWPAPDGLVQTNLLTNQISDATAAFVRGVDFVVVGDKIQFRDDPFADPRLVVVDQFSGGEIVDRSVTLWIYRGEFDHDDLFTQFGYVLGLRLPGSLAARNAINAVFDGVTAGASAGAVEDYLAALCGVSLAIGDETVEVVLPLTNRLLVVTDRTVYRFSGEANAVVAVGDRLVPGQAICDVVRVCEFNRGTVPDAVRALGLPPGVVRGTLDAIVFENKTVDLVVDTPEDDYTRVEFEIGGRPSDVEAFWDAVHTAGVAKNQTLAMLLDRRETPNGQPGASSLPPTINPLAFLIANVFRGESAIAVVRPTAVSAGAPGLRGANRLRSIVPPWNFFAVLIEFETTDLVVMAGPGTADEPGYEESVTPFSAAATSDMIDPSSYVTESVRVYRVGGQCK
jgi:hypothetical protein